MKIAAKNINLHVLDTGSGSPALVFLHYWGGSARTWRPVTEQLEASFRCIAYDQRGWGQSDAPAQGYELEDLAGDAASLVEALALKRYVLVGHSMGGKAAQLLASRRPAGLDALILVAPASPLPQRLPDEAREAQKHAYDTRDTALAAIAFLTAAMPSAQVVEQLVQDSLAGSPGAKHAWPASAAYQDISGYVRNIAVPTLVLVGDRDPQDPEEQQRRELLPLIPGARLQVISHCGHLMPVEQPAALADAIAAFLRSL